jgi:hypothetical protein
MVMIEIVFFVMKITRTRLTRKSVTDTMLVGVMGHYLVGEPNEKCHYQYPKTGPAGYFHNQL